MNVALLQDPWYKQRSLAQESSAHLLQGTLSTIQKTRFWAAFALLILLVLMIKEIRSLEQSFSGRHEIMIRYYLLPSEFRPIHDGVTLRLIRGSDRVLREKVHPPGSSSVCVRTSFDGHILGSTNS